MLAELSENTCRLWDAHVHLFPSRLFSAIWRWFDNNSIYLPYRGMDNTDFTAHLKGMGVERAFLLAYAHRSDISSGVNRWLHNFCAQNPMYLPFGCVHPGDRHLKGVIEEALDVFGFPGLKIHCQVARIRADDPGLTPIYNELEKRGRMLVIHGGTAPMPVPLLGMDMMERVLAAHPGLTVQVAHLGHFEIDKTARLLENYPGLYLDTAWALGNDYMQVDLGAVRDLIAGFPGRVLYGSDFPIIPEDPCLTVEKIEKLSLPERVIQDVLCNNAERIITGLLGRYYK